MPQLDIADKQFSNYGAGVGGKRGLPLVSGFSASPLRRFAGYECPRRAVECHFNGARGDKGATRLLPNPYGVKTLLDLFSDTPRLIPRKGKGNVRKAAQSYIPPPPGDTDTEHPRPRSAFCDPEVKAGDAANSVESPL